MTIAIVISAALSALVLVLALVLPSVTSPTVPFGVRVPAQRAHDPAVARQTRIYRWRVLLSGIIASGACVTIFGITGVTLLLPLSVLVLLGVWYACFFLANHEIRAAKAAGDWYEGLRQAITVDTTLRTDPPKFPWLWLAPPLIITIGTAIVGVIMYPTMPAVLVVHNGTNPAAIRTAAKSVGSAFSLVFVQIGVTAVLVGVALAIFFRGRSDIDPSHPVSSAQWYRRYLALGTKSLLGLLAMIDLGLLGAALLMWTGTVTRFAPLVVVIPILVSVAVVITVLARNNRERDDNEGDTGLTHRDDDKYWRGGMFYVNKEDHALWVQRRFGIGFTLNFGNPRVAMLGAGIAALIALLITIRLGGW